MTGTVPITVLIGPTASGKSAVALRLAHQSGAEILSVDSMQVYRGMDVGTAKPSAAERADVEHHLLDLVDPTEQFTVARFVEAADAVIAQSRAPLIATGGTPMFFKALFEGLFQGPSADAALRQQLLDQPADQLYARLLSIDPAAAGRIHANDSRRVVRALEVFELTGRTITSFQSQWGQEPRHAARWFGLSWDKDALNRRINARVKQMIADGWVEEVRQLLNQFGSLSQTAGEATGYAELIEHARGRISLEDAIEQIKIATRQLARRQMKWFRRFPNVTWIDGDQSVDQIVQQMTDALASGGES
jgi:tRNA dimethylallyltransferase